MNTQSFTILQFPKIGLTHKNSPQWSRQLSQSTLLRASEARFTGASSKGGKCAESPPTFIRGKCQKNRRKQSWRIFQIRELYLCLRKVLAPLTFIPKDNSLKLELCEVMFLNFYFFLIFEVDKSGALAPTYPPSKRKSNLRSSFKRANQAILFTWKVVLLRRWTLKWSILLGEKNWGIKP